MKWISGSVCAALVAGSVVGGTVFGRPAGAATPYDDCNKSPVTSTTERVTCQYTTAGVTEALPIPGIATDVRVYAIGGRGALNVFSDLSRQVSFDAPLGGVAGRTLKLTVGGDAQGSTGGANGGASGAGWAGGGGGATTITLTDGTPVFVAPGAGGSGAPGQENSGDGSVSGGAGATPYYGATSGDSADLYYGGGSAGGSAVGASPGSGGSGGYITSPAGGGSSHSGADGTDGTTAGTGGAGGDGSFSDPTNQDCSPFSGGGGGGGGYAGGGGGGAGSQTRGPSPDCGGGGGGGAGSSYNWPASFEQGAVTNTAETSAGRYLSISWTQELAITSGDAPNGAVSQPYTFQFTADQPNTSFRVVSGSTPPGLTLDPDGLLHGTPTTKASYGFTVEASDPDRAAQRTTVQSITIGAAPVAFTNAPPNATKGKAYSFQFTASNCAGCVFTRVAGQGGLPHGLSLSSAGKLSGTPTTVENASFVVQASAADGRSSQQQFPVRVLSAPALVVNDVSVSESSGTAKFTITLNPAASGTVSVHYATANGTAVAPGDYTAVSGTATFTAGQTTKTITVPIKNDTIHEGAETFRLVLSAPSGATIADSSGTATITASD